MKKHTINKFPKHVSDNVLSNYIKITSPSQLKNDIEVFKIDYFSKTILGVDFYSSELSKRIINNEIKQGNIYIKKVKL